MKSNSSVPATSRFLLVGLGSIGKRHLKNLRFLQPQARIAVLRRPGGSESEAIAIGADVVFTELTDAIDFSPHAAIIANPAPFHFETAAELVRAGVPLLVEKPLALDVEEALTLLGMCSKHSVMLSVGYNLRFLPSLKAARDSVRAGDIGEVFFVRSEVGQYLPDWRKGSDYRLGVSAQARLGGGVLLELSHEIDYILWMFGMPNRVSAIGGLSGQLEVDVEDIVELTLHYDHPWRLVSIHLDMLQRKPYRRCRAVGTRGSIEWDALADTVLIDRLEETGSYLLQDLTLMDKNEVYINELRDFIEAALTGCAPCCTGEDGLRALAVIGAARLSLAQSGRAIEPCLRRAA